MLTMRLAKIAMVAAIAAFATLVAFGNITDYGTNFAFVGANSSDSGNNIAIAAPPVGGPLPPAIGGGFNFAIIAPGSVSEGNNTGGGINIAILPTAAAPGNCAKTLCINLFGFQLI